MKNILLIIIVLSFISCTTTSSDYDRITSISLDNLNKQISTTKSSSIIEILSASTILERNELDVEINPQSSKIFEKEEKKYLTRSFMINEKIKILNITSYIIPIKRKADYLFFPSLTAFDKQKNNLGRLKPEKNYSISEGKLNISFIIPENTKYLMLHTEAEYLNLDSIDGSQGGLHPSRSYDSQNLGNAIAAVLGGAIGGAIAGALSSNTGYDSAAPENYFFGPGGIVDIEVIK